MPVCNKDIPEKPIEESEYLDLDANVNKTQEEYINIPTTAPSSKKHTEVEGTPLYMNLRI